MFACSRLSLHPHSLTHPLSLPCPLHTTQDYFDGLEQYVGTPSPDIWNAIEREHNDETKFSSHNVKDTSPKYEFDYAAKGECGNRPNGFVGDFNRKQDLGPKEVRYGWGLDDFCMHDQAREAKLLREEVLSLRLYTGPMYVWYNNRVLRKAKRGLYVTTIHAINSAIVKLSRFQKCVTVYRGVAGGVLPDAFFTPDANGAVGGVEAAFMSTTTERTVAMDYAQRKGADGAPRPSMLFHIKMGMIDKGANVSFLSQFPSECEILFAPLTGLEVTSRPWVEGSTVVVDLRLNCNHSTLTIEQVIGKMKRSHIDLIDLMIDDLTYSGAPQRALLSLTSLKAESSSREASEFNIAKNYSSATARALAAQKDCLNSLGDRSSWDGEPGTAKDVAARMLKVVTLQARAGEHEDARHLLFQAIERDPLPHDLEVKMSAAEKAVAEKGEKDVRLPPEDRKVFAAAVLLLHRGATPPWPPMMVSLLNMLSEKGVKAFGQILSAVDPHRTKPTFPNGTQVMVWSEEKHRWEDGVVKGAKGRGTYEVQSRGIETLTLPAKYVMRAEEGGVGALSYEAARKGSYLLLDSLLKGGVSPFECDLRGNTALIYAVRRGNAQMCQRLIKAGADAEVQNKQGAAAWDLALQCGHAGVRRIFSPSAADRDLSKPLLGATDLMTAAWKGDKEKLEEAIKHRPMEVDDVSKSGGTSALMLAARKGHLEIVELLLQGKAKVGLRSRRGTSALSMAAEEGQIEVVEALLSSSGGDRPNIHDTDDDGYTALGVACENGHAPCVQALLRAKSDPNQQRKNGWTSLITSSYNGYVEVVKALIDGGADPNKAKDNGYNAVIAAAYNGFDKVVETLLELKANPDQPMTNGWNALMVASAQGHASVVDCLCEAGASVDYCRQANGFSALMSAASTVHDATCATILLQHRANVNLQDTLGCDALMHAAWHGQSEACAALIQSNANVLAVRPGGTTALMDAAAGGHEQIVKQLIEAGADWNAVDAHGMSVLMHAARAGHDTCMVPLLARHAASSNSNRINIKDNQQKTALAHAATAEVYDRLVAAGASGAAKIAKPEPRNPNKGSGSPEMLRVQEVEAAASARGRPNTARGKSPSTARGATPSAAPSAATEEVQAGQRHEAMSAKDFLRVRPRQEKQESVTTKTTKSKAAPAFTPGQGRAGSAPAARVSIASLKAAQDKMDPAERRKDKAARKLQEIFKKRFNQKLRAESQLFSLLKDFKGGIGNHWGSGGA